MFLFKELPNTLCVTNTRTCVTYFNQQLALRLRLSRCGWIDRPVNRQHNSALFSELNGVVQQVCQYLYQSRAITKNPFGQHLAVMNNKLHTLFFDWRTIHRLNVLQNPR